MILLKVDMNVIANLVTLVMDLFAMILTNVTLIQITVTKMLSVSIIPLAMIAHVISDMKD